MPVLLISSCLQWSSDSHSKAELDCKSQMTNANIAALPFLFTSSSSFSLSSPQLPITCFYLSTPPTPDSDWQWQTEMDSSTEFTPFPLLWSTEPPTLTHIKFYTNIKAQRAAIWKETFRHLWQLKGWNKKMTKCTLYISHPLLACP